MQRCASMRSRCVWRDPIPRSRRWLGESSRHDIGVFPAPDSNKEVHMFMTKDFIILGTTGVLLFGCGQSSQEPSRSGGYVKDVEVAAAVGATIDVTDRDSADLAGTRLVISQGAIARDTRITLQFQSASIIAGNAV